MSIEPIIFALMEDHLFSVLLLIMLMVISLIFFVKKQTVKKDVSLKMNTDRRAALIDIAIKTILFFIVIWLLNYIFDAFSLMKKKGGINDWKTIVFYRMFITITFTAMMANIFINIMFAIMYIYFNIQLTFAAIIVLFFPFDGFDDSGFLLSFVILSALILIGWLFFKIKKKVLHSIRTFFNFILTYTASTSQNTEIIRFTAKVVEFYVVCIPYMVYSGLSSILILRGGFNLPTHLIISHLFSYFIIYRLYKEGQDIGFDYDPF